MHARFIGSSPVYDSCVRIFNFLELIVTSLNFSWPSVYLKLKKSFLDVFQFNEVYDSENCACTIILPLTNLLTPFVVEYFVNN